MKIALATPVGSGRDYLRPKTDLIEKYSGITKDFRLREQRQELFHVSDDLYGTHFHTNYLEYLHKAWEGHYGIVMTPDIMWHTLLSEIVALVAENPTAYADMFTTTPDKKQSLFIQSQDPSVMPLPALVDLLRNIVPTNADLFLPEFSTTTNRSKLCRYASFADLVSPFYTYHTYACGIPYIDVQGTDEDWQRVKDSWCQISVRFYQRHGVYVMLVGERLAQLCREKHNPDFWRDMFRMDVCGSGHQYQIKGWFSDELFCRHPKNDTLSFVENFPTHLARVKYQDLSSKQNYELVAGLLCSELDGDCLIPDFGQIVYHRPEQVKVEPWDPYAGSVATKQFVEALRAKS